MPIEETCTVVKVSGKTAVIELTRSPKCEGCNACAFNKRNKIRMPAIREVECSAGDTVTVVMPEKQIALAPLFLFVIPILFALAAVLIARYWAAWAQAVLIIGFLAVGFTILFIVDKLYRRQRKFMPIITQRNHIGEEKHD